ncbi:hypothetical protein IFM89_030442 [Coptis chinensis]|uniref:Uncharacterized protein n=1 Tax=Coptis chinensis TaxID=261450 RepID=A0A835LK93_9MAGN|nr:hypothetical protein IFM89_030442 [Coptis chinensis]
MPFIGFGRLREYLEEELQKRYKEAVSATLALLEQRCDEVSIDLARMDSKIKDTSDVAYLRRSVMLHATSISGHIVSDMLRLYSPYVRVGINLSLRQFMKYCFGWVTSKISICNV